MWLLEFLFGRPMHGGDGNKAADIRSVPRNTTEGSGFGDAADSNLRADQKTSGRDQRIIENVQSGVDNSAYSAASSPTYITFNGFQPSDNPSSEQQRRAQAPIEDAGPSNPTASVDPRQINEYMEKEIRRRVFEYKEALEKQLRDYDAENRRLEDQLRDSKNDLRQCERNNRSLEYQLKASEDTLRDSKRDLRQSELEIRTLKAQIKESGNSLGESERMLALSRDVLRQSERENRDLANKLKHREGSMREHDDRDPLEHIHRLFSSSGTTGVDSPTGLSFDIVLRPSGKSKVWDKDFNLMRT